jgi:hypothetical protein
MFVIDCQWIRFSSFLEEKILTQSACPAQRQTWTAPIEILRSDTLHQIACNAHTRHAMSHQSKKYPKFVQEVQISTLCESHSKMHYKCERMLRTSGGGDQRPVDTNGVHRVPEANELSRVLDRYGGYI